MKNYDVVVIGAGNGGFGAAAALAQNGLKPAARCRTGICGFCRAYVVNGSFTLAETETGVRSMDKKLGFIHPCCSYPASDLEIVVHRG